MLWVTNYIRDTYRKITMIDRLVTDTWTMYNADDRVTPELIHISIHKKHLLVATNRAGYFGATIYIWQSTTIYVSDSASVYYIVVCDFHYVSYKYFVVVAPCVYIELKGRVLMLWIISVSKCVMSN